VQRYGFLENLPTSKNSKTNSNCNGNIKYNFNDNANSSGINKINKRIEINRKLITKKLLIFTKKGLIKTCILLTLWERIVRAFSAVLIPAIHFIFFLAEKARKKDAISIWAK
jgi:hypothetical protein